MDATLGTRPAQTERTPPLDAQWSDSTSRCGATIFRGKDDSRASRRTKLGGRPTVAGRDLHYGRWISNGDCRLILKDPVSECRGDLSPAYGSMPTPTPILALRRSCRLTE